VQTTTPSWEMVLILTCRKIIFQEYCEKQRPFQNPRGACVRVLILGHTNLIPWIAGAPNLTLGGWWKIKKGSKTNFFQTFKKRLLKLVF
jgi:hypothetical protein